MEKRLRDIKENYRTGEVTQLRRIADSLDEILRLIKADQEQYKKKSKDEEEQSWPTGLGKEENAKEEN